MPSPKTALELMAHLGSFDDSSEPAFDIGTVSTLNANGNGDGAIYVQYGGEIDDDENPVESQNAIWPITGYQPVVGDRVLLAVVGETWVALGALNTAVGWDGPTGALIGENEGTTGNTVTLTTGGTNFIVPVGTVTFTLAVQRRVRIVGQVRYDAGTTAAAAQMQVAYVAGASATLTGAVLLGQGGGQEQTVPVSSIANFTKEHSVLLAAGQYTAFVVVQRVVGGTATDLGRAAYCAVYDVGAA